MKTKTKEEVASFDIEGLKGSELLVSYQAIAKCYPSTIEEGHGLHEINDDDLNVCVERVEVVIFGRSIDITKQLTEKEFKKLSENIVPQF